MLLPFVHVGRVVLSNMTYKIWVAIGVSLGEVTTTLVGREDTSAPNHLGP